METDREGNTQGKEEYEGVAWSAVVLSLVAVVVEVRLVVVARSGLIQHLEYLEYLKK